jgi:hypothetical protein
MSNHVTQADDKGLPCPRCGSPLIVVECDDLYVERDCSHCDYGEIRCRSCGDQVIECYCR